MKQLAIIGTPQPTGLVSVLLAQLAMDARVPEQRPPDPRVVVGIDLAHQPAKFVISDTCGTTYDCGTTDGPAKPVCSPKDFGMRRRRR